jgi:hypothetical protein
LNLKDNITLREERGNTFIMFLKEGRKGDCRDAENSKKDPGTSEETTPECQTYICESLWKKMMGKPCAGKPHARFEVAGDGKVLWRT